MWTGQTASLYFVYSERKTTPPRRLTDRIGWISALWQMRKEFGADFTDRVLFYAIGASEPKAKELNGYFYDRLMQEESVVDNNL